MGVEWGRASRGGEHSFICSFLFLRLHMSHVIIISILTPGTGHRSDIDSDEGESR